LWAYRFSPQSNSDGERPEHFSCAALCRKQGTAQLVPYAQAARNCALPGFNVGTWTGDRLVRIHMGRGRDYSREGKGDWAAPAERIDETGCPGAWYRTAFVDSVLRYYRRRDRNGNRIENPLLTRCTDELVLEAIRAIESYEDAAAGEAEAAAIAAAKRKD